MPVLFSSTIIKYLFFVKGSKEETKRDIFITKSVPDPKSEQVLGLRVSSTTIDRLRNHFRSGLLYAAVVNSSGKLRVHLVFYLHQPLWKNGRDRIDRDSHAFHAR